MHDEAAAGGHGGVTVTDLSCLSPVREDTTAGQSQGGVGGWEEGGQYHPTHWRDLSH